MRTALLVLCARASALRVGVRPSPRIISVTFTLQETAMLSAVASWCPTRTRGIRLDAIAPPSPPAGQLPVVPPPAAETQSISVTVTREDGHKAYAAGTVKVAAGAAASDAAAGAGNEEGPSPFEQMDIRVGEIVEAWEHPDSDKLWCEKIDVGEEEPREIASGLRAYYATKEEMMGRKVLVVCNLKPAKLAGFASNGMVLCASSADRSTVAFVEPPAESVPGERVLCEGAAPVAPASPNAVKKKKWMEKTAEGLRAVDTIATFRGVPLVTPSGKCSSPSVAEGTIN